MNISEKEHNKIQSLYTLNGVNEIEVRFGKFTSNNFSPEISLDDFTRLNSFLQTFCILKNIEYSIIKIVNSTRKIDIMTNPIDFQFADYDNCKIQFTQISKKTKLNTVDLKEYNIRFSASKEEVINVFPNSIPDFTKTRKRFIYIYNDIIFHLSMYKILDQDTPIKYDIEIEIQDVQNFDNFMIFLKNTFMYAFQHTNKVITNKTRNDISKDYYQIVNTKKFIGVQPESLRYEKINKGEKYAVSDKFDGERKLLFFRKSRIIVISKNSPIWILNKEQIKEDYSGTILDCEFMNGEFYVFDVLFFKMRSMSDLLLKERIKIYENIVNDLEYPILKKKPYYFGNLYNVVTDRLEKQDKNITDGIILTPFNSKNGIPLKFKNEKPNTIDFKIIKKEEKIENKYEIWELYCYDSDKKDILFKIPEYNINGICIIPLEISKNYINGSIVEFKYDKINNNFIPIKPRFDKKNGNFYDVAIDNFYLDIYPFHVSFLKNLETPLDLDYIYNFNFKRFKNFCKRSVISNLNSKGNMLWLNCKKGNDVFKLIDYNIRNIYINGGDYDKFFSKYEKIKEMEITKNYNFEIIMDDFLHIKNTFDMVLSFDKNAYWSVDNIKKVSEILNTNGKLLISVINTDEMVLPFKSKILDIYTDRNSVILHGNIYKKRKTYNLNNIQNLIKSFGNYNLKVTYLKNSREYYNDWVENDNFMSITEKKIAEMITYIIFEKHN